MSSTCDVLVRSASSGVAASLRAVDCVSTEAASGAFTRLFGTQGALLPALTILLTLYVGVFAMLLLTGRTRLSIGSLTPRMITLGLVLTFTTSSVAYQGVVWNLAVGAPDQIAGLLLGAQGSATQMFANRIDILFNAIAETAASTTQSGSPQAAGSFTPGNLMWLGALLMMLGTVGVLVTARIALAILLAVGPVFICMALFSGSRGLFAGWLRALVLTALTPLFAVLCGALMTELAVPVVGALRGEDGIDGRAAMALFVIAAVHCALMSMAIRVASTMVAGWNAFGLTGNPGKGERGTAAAAATPAPTFAAPLNTMTPRVQTVVAGLSAANLNGGGTSVSSARATHTLRHTVSAGPAAAAPASGRLRTHGIGSRFARPAARARNRV